MGANARKINNARSQQVFDEASTAYKGNVNPTALEGQVQGIANKPYSEQETADMRSRSLSPIQSAYGHSGEEMSRQALLNGGSPNLIASMAKNNRNRVQALSEGNTDVNARLASDTIDKKLQASGLLGQLQDQRQRYGLGLINSQSNVQPHKGFGWSGLTGFLGNIMPFLSKLGGGGANNQDEMYKTTPDYQDPR